MTEQRGRADRQTIESGERRRRSDDTIDGGLALKLGIPPEIEASLKAEGRTARWVNDVGSRLHDTTVRDDWARVQGVEPRSVKIDVKTGAMTKAILVSKRIDFVEEDRAKKEARRKRQETATFTGHDPQTGQSTLPANQYVHKDTKIDRGNQILE